MCKKPKPKIFTVKLPYFEAIAFEELIRAESSNPNRFLRAAINQAIQNQCSEKSPAA